jgi:hypothetical protein
LWFFRVLSAASATSPTCSPIDLNRCAADVSVSRSSLLKGFDFFIGLGNETPRSRFIGPLDSVRLFNATPPAIPARAAPPASSGVFAFEAKFETLSPVLRTKEGTEGTEGVLAFGVSSATFSPALPIGPFEGVGRDRALAVLDRWEPVARALLDPRRARAEVFVLDEPFLLVDAFLLEPRCVERLERVVWAISSPLCLASLPAASAGPGPSLPAKPRIRTASSG